MDNCEARTRSAKNDAAAANNVVWIQKIAFPACSARSLVKRPGFFWVKSAGSCRVQGDTSGCSSVGFYGACAGFVGRLGNVRIKNGKQRQWRRPLMGSAADALASVDSFEAQC